jgi:hypothetical protein
MSRTRTPRIVYTITARALRTVEGGTIRITRELRRVRTRMERSAKVPARTRTTVRTTAPARRVRATKAA